MRIQNLKQPQEAIAPHRESASPPIMSGAGAVPDRDESRSHASGETAPNCERHLLEVALLNARIQHLELVIETARSLMSSNQERLLRRLHEVPREIADLGTRLRQLDPSGL